MPFREKNFRDVENEKRLVGFEPATQIWGL